MDEKQKLKSMRKSFQNIIELLLTPAPGFIRSSGLEAGQNEVLFSARLDVDTSSSLGDA